MHYFDKIPLQPQLYMLEGDPDVLTEFTSYLLVKRAPSLVLDSGNSFNPFTISLFCRKLNRDAMEQIFVSRAFTVFQLRTLVTEALPEFIRERDPSVIVVSFFSNLFHSDDVEENVLTILHKKLLLQLKETVKIYEIPVIVTEHADKSWALSDSIINHLFDCRISFKTKRHTMVLLVDQKKLQFPLVPPTQKTLDVWRDSYG